MIIILCIKIYKLLLLTYTYEMKDRMSIVIVLSDRLKRRRLEVDTLQYLCKRGIKLLNVVYTVYLLHY